MAEVSVRNITKTFAALKALDDVTMDFPDGGFFALLGPSGSGKTTLLRTIAGFIFADSGSIYIDDRPVGNVPVEKRDIGMMFQNYALFPNMSVADNIGFGLRVRKVGAAEERRRIGEVLELVQLGQHHDRKPHQLSGGQRQRVALARAIVTNPGVLLLDEPLSALDKALRVDMQIELKRIQRETGITTIFVTHDQEEALTLSDRIGILKDGVMVQADSPREIYHHPVDLFTATFLGEANILLADTGDRGLLDSPGASITIPQHVKAGSVCLVRPESMKITREKPAAGGHSCVRGRLVQRIFAGAMATCIVESAGREIRVVAKDRDLPDAGEGDQVWVCWEDERMFSVPKN